jgi:pre-mRNA-splicing factor 18
MDFASLMSKQLAKAKGKDSDGSSAPTNKYVKRSEVEANREAAYIASQRALQAEREAKATAKRKREEEVAAENKAREEKRQKLAEESRIRRLAQEEEEERTRRKRLGLPELKKVAEEDDELEDGLEDVPEEELILKLREMGAPVRLFGEGHAARVRRFVRLTTVVTDGPIPTTLKLVEEKDMKLDGTVPTDKEGRKWLFRQLASYFTMVLTEYEKAMEAERRDTSASRTAYNAMVQSRENMKPVSRPHLTYPFPLVYLLPTHTSPNYGSLSMQPIRD